MCTTIVVFECARNNGLLARACCGEGNGGRGAAEPCSCGAIMASRRGRARHSGGLQREGSAAAPRRREPDGDDAVLCRVPRLYAQNAARRPQVVPRVGWHVVGAAAPADMTC